MAAGRSLRCLLLVGSVTALWLLCPQADEKLLQTQEQRKSRLQETCRTRTWRSFEELRDSELRQFIVDDKHGIIYCYVPKVACTNWKRVLYALNRTESYPDLRSVRGDLVHKESTFTFLSSFPRAERQARLKHYTKFLFVREPFVRLISVYRNKFEGSKEDFYKYYGRGILRRYAHMPNPPESAREAFELGIRPTFRHFVRYLLDPRTRKFQEHWRQMHGLCHPCTVQYDFIGHLETLQKDASLLLKMLKLDGDISFPPSAQIPASTDQLWDWFRTVPLEDRRRLYAIYELDYQLFGYARPRPLLDGDGN